MINDQEDYVLDLSEDGFNPNIWVVTHVLYAGKSRKTTETKSPGIPVFVAVMYNACLNISQKKVEHHQFFFIRREDSEARRFLRDGLRMKIPPLTHDLQTLFNKIDAYCIAHRPHITFEYATDDKRHYKMINIQPYNGPIQVPGVFHKIPDVVLERLKEKGYDYATKETAGRDPIKNYRRGPDTSGARRVDENDSPTDDEPVSTNDDY